MNVHWIMHILKYYRSLKDSKCLHSFSIPPGQRFLISVFQKTISPPIYYFMTHKIYPGSKHRCQQPTYSYTFLFTPSVSWLNRQAFIYSWYLTLNWISKSLERPTRNDNSYQRTNCVIIRFVCLISTNRTLIFMGKVSSMRNTTIFAKARYIFAKERTFDYNFSMCCFLKLASFRLLHSVLTILKGPCLVVKI